MRVDLSWFFVVVFTPLLAMTLSVYAWRLYKCYKRRAK